jgi:hypothetical protein
MRVRKRLAQLATLPLLVASVTAIGAAPATAETAPTLTRYTVETLAATTRPAALAQGKSAERVQAFLDQAAGSGRLVDIARVRVATITDPEAGQVDLVWDDFAEPQYVGVTHKDGETEGSGQTGVGVVFAETAAQLPPVPGAGGFGYETGYDPSGMYKYGNTGCRTVYYTPKYGHTSDHWSTQCYEKYARSGASNWIYNRWALWNRGKPTASWHAWTIDFAIRSRPWKGEEYKVAALDGWTPASGHSNCSEEINVTLNAGPGSLKIPIHRCSTTTVMPDATKKGMGMDWNGQTEDQLFEDFGMAVRANDSSTVPVMADYLWAEVQYCGSGQADCYGADPSEYLQDTDSGWGSANGSGPECDFYVKSGAAGPRVVGSSYIGEQQLMTPCH